MAAAATAEPATVQQAWPPEAATRPFIEYLKSQYDMTQLRAIEVELQSCVPESLKVLEMHSTYQIR